MKCHCTGVLMGQVIKEMIQLYLWVIYVFIHVSVIITHMLTQTYPGGGGGYLNWKRVPTVVQPLRSDGCRDTRWLKISAPECPPPSTPRSECTFKKSN